MSMHSQIPGQGTVDEVLLQTHTLHPTSTSKCPLQVTDFDMAVKAQEGPVSCSMTSPSYAHLAPEVSKSSDVYAFGVLLWELLMGEPAWQGLSTKDVAANVVMKKMQLAFPDYETTPYKVLAALHSHVVLLR